MTLPTPNTVIIGAGPVATALAGAMRLGGVPVLGLWARNPEAARAAGVVTGVATYSSAPPDILLEAQAIVCAVRDDAIGDVAATLVNSGLVTTRHVLLHCSGSLSAEAAFAGVAGKVGGIAVMHPLRAIADPRSAMRSLGGTVFGVEGDSRGREVAQALVTALRGRVLQLEGNGIAAYHAGASLASNFVVALIDVAAELLVSAGISKERAVEAVIPLTRGAIDNVAEHGLPGGLTGPIRRGDVTTVERHVSAISRSGGDAAAIYSALAGRLVHMARELGHASERELVEISGAVEVVSKSAAGRGAGH